MERVAMLGADGRPLGWTYDAEQHALVTAAVLEVVGAEWVALRDVVAHVQRALGEHPAFPSGRLTNATRYVAADLQGRGRLERATGSGSVRARAAPRGRL